MDEQLTYEIILEELKISIAKDKETMETLKDNIKWNEMLVAAVEYMPKTRKP